MPSPDRTTNNVAVPATNLDHARNPKYKAPGTDRVYECELLNKIHAPPSTYSVHVPPKGLTTLSHLLKKARDACKTLIMIRLHTGNPLNIGAPHKLSPQSPSAAGVTKVINDLGYELAIPTSWKLQECGIGGNARTA